MLWKFVFVRLRVGPAIILHAHRSDAGIVLVLVRRLCLKLRTGAC